jgi:hypothetical protein
VVLSGTSSQTIDQEQIMTKRHSKFWLLLRSGLIIASMSVIAFVEVNGVETATNHEGSDVGSVIVSGSPNTRTSPKSLAATELKRQVIGSGGGSATAGIYSTSATIGQTSVGSGSSSIYTVNQGYWTATGPSYVCGDANGDAAVNISDAVSLIAYIFAGGPAPSPLLAGDANCDSAVNISDAVYLIAYIFAGGPAPCAACK